MVDSMPIKRGVTWRQGASYLITALLVIYGLKIGLYLENGMLNSHNASLVFLGIVAGAFAIRLGVDLLKKRDLKISIIHNMLLAVIVGLCFVVSAQLVSLMWDEEDLFSVIMAVGVVVLVTLSPLIVFRSLTSRSKKILLIVLILANLFNAYNLYLANFREVNLVKGFFLAIMEKDQPDEDISALVPEYMAEDIELYFYSFKVWFIETGTTSLDILLGFTTSADKSRERTVYDFYYGYDEKFHCFATKDGGVVKLGGIYFESTDFWSADYNQDGQVDQADVEAAIQERKSKLWFN